MYKANVAVVDVQPGGKHSNRWAVNVNMYPWQPTRHRDQRPPQWRLCHRRSNSYSNMVI